MPTWEFLLQKKGDKSWLPLESPNLEILEGEYRLAAKSGLGKTEAEIQIDYAPSSQLATESWHINRAVNPQGLLLIMPFSDLTAGTWKFCCDVANFGVKSLCIEVLEKIADFDWDFDFLVNDNQDLAPNDGFNSSELIPALSIPILSNPILSNPILSKPILSNPALPKELIILHNSDFALASSIEISGEAYVSGEIEITLRDHNGCFIHQKFAHDASDSDFFSHIIIFNEQPEVPILCGEVKIHPHSQLTKNDHIKSQTLVVNCQNSANLFRKFPLLPFENLPGYVSIRRNIKFPELPEFLTLSKKIKPEKALASSQKPIPNWKISNYDGDLRYEFE